MTIKHFYFPDEFLELQKEISYHQHLIIKVMQAADYVAPNVFEHTMEPTDWLTTFLMKLAAVCTYLNILVDGHYDERQIKNLCKICTERLQKQRKEWRVDHDE